MSILQERTSVARIPVIPLGPHFGGEIHGIDLARLGDDEVLALREALVNHKVLFVRGQHGLDDAAQIDFSRRPGEVTLGHPVHDSGDVRLHRPGQLPSPSGREPLAGGDRGRGENP